jgi:hypothetical protein
MYRVELTYAFRSGTLAGVAGRATIRVFARVTPDHIAGWEKQQELRVGKWTPSDHVFVPPGGPDQAKRVLRLSKPTGPAFVSTSSVCNAPNRSNGVFVDDGAGGCFIHDWPPCRCARCILLPPGSLGQLVGALDDTGTLTIVG